MKLWTLYYSFVLHIKPYFQSLIDDKGFSTFPIDSNHTICLSSFFFILGFLSWNLFFFKTEHLFTNYKGGRIDYLVFLLFTRRKFVTSVRCRMKTPIWLFFPIFLIHFSQVKDVKESLQSCCFKIYFFLFRLRGFLCRLTSECQERPKCRVLTYDFGTLDNYRHSVVSCVNTWFTLNILKVSSTNLKCAIKRRIKRLERLKFTIVNVHQNIWTQKKIDTLKNSLFFSDQKHFRAFRCTKFF